MDTTNNSRRQVEKAPTEQSGKGEDDDRLSNLPEPLIHHILSFLDTKSAVQTSLLFRKWESTWKHLSVLDMRHSSVIPDKSPPGFKSLKTLELSWFSFSNRFRCSGFQMLEKLDLFGCTFFADQVDDIVVVEPFASLPCLKDLTLIMLFGAGSNHDMRFRISGLQLLRLHLSFISYRKMEIYAPKLKHFKFEYLENHMVEFTELTVPSLEHAEIEVEYQDGENNKLLGDISDYLEDQPSPFTRLKSLIIGSMWPGEDVSFAVLNYLLKGSSDAKPAVKFRSA
ncbi:F-box/FBD/LRR-repeat protein At5g53840 [Linum grandiflorum]